MKTFRKIMSFVLVLTFVLSFGIRAHAADKTTVSETFTNNSNTEQWRFIVVTKDPQWTNYKVVSGQPTKGTHLRKGDMLYYNDSGGSSANVSFSCALGVAGVGSVSVSVSVPLGQASGSGVGTALRASKEGYYVIKARKYIQPTITFVQYRYRSVTSNSWGSWTNPSVHNKEYTVVKKDPVLVRK